ncbi:plasmid replication protein RepC [Rhizobium sp. RAF56]|uniref:plasmid replication protein RepC n=1 Tax=Rhizobium sp. RAF56 TaxID=3233062 RepID=UPI003F9AADC7
MQTGHVTTPFGARPMTLALVKRQLQTAEAKPAGSIDKWKVFRDACEAREKLGVADRAIAVLNALLSFYPQQELSAENGLVVFPSNAQLTIRAHGIAGTTLRRHLAALVEAGLIIRKDSPNGKRYARKDRGGEIEDAFGFSLAPLVARAAELAQLAQDVAAQRREHKLARERLTIARRDVRKLISAAIEEGAPGNWDAIENQFIALATRIPRNPSPETLADIAEEMEMLRDEIVNSLEVFTNSEKTDSNDNHSGHHIQNSNTDSTDELEPRSEQEQGAKPNPAGRVTSEPIKSFPLGLVLQACPDIAMYGPGGAIGNWRDLMSAAVVVRSMLGVSPSAYQAACEAMGPENAAAAIACILERAGHINSAGGYLRDLTRKAERGEFSLGPMLMALMRSGSMQAQTSRPANG